MRRAELNRFVRARTGRGRVMLVTFLASLKHTFEYVQRVYKDFLSVVVIGLFRFWGRSPKSRYVNEVFDIHFDNSENIVRDMSIV